MSKTYLIALFIFLLLSIMIIITNPNPLIYIPFIGLSICYFLHYLMSKEEN